MVGRIEGDVRVERLRDRAIEQLDDATASLSLLDEDPVSAVHETRKRIKATRAVLRLLLATDKSRFNHEDAILGAASRRLSPIRDRHVAHHLASTLGRWPQNMVPPPLAPWARSATLHTGMAIIGVRNRTERWDLSEVGSNDLLGGLDKSYRLARRRWNRCIDHLENDDLHQCRKSVKRTANQLVMFDSAFAQTERLERLQQLGELLGDHHDLSLVPDRNRDRETTLEGQIVDLGIDVFSLSPRDHNAWVHATFD